MNFYSPLILSFILGTFLMMWTETSAHKSSDSDEYGYKSAALNALYNSLLQREYAEPVVFPNHQVERKAQRSPSLRLRFGRRSDPDLVPHTAEKRWFDEVNQKPIRSPSLRLRFGRRSDPLMPMHSPLDMIMNEANGNQVEQDLFDDNDVALADNEEDLYNSLMHSQKLRNLLMFLINYGDSKDIEDLSSKSAPSSSSVLLGEKMDEYERAIRKPGPLRLRWGRSTGGLSFVGVNSVKPKNDLEQKNKVTVISNEIDKSLNPQNKD